MLYFTTHQGKKQETWQQTTNNDTHTHTYNMYNENTKRNHNTKATGDEVPRQSSGSIPEHSDPGMPVTQ